MADQDRKDEIISMQLELIRKMTENQIRRVSDDIWGPSKKPSGNIILPELNGNTNSPSDQVSESEKPEKDLTKAADGSDVNNEKAEEDDIPPVESMEDLKKELDSYIGLEQVKKEVKNLINMATVYKLRREHDLPTADMSLHMVFSGNPGTGKTMIARFMSRVYHSLGLLSKGKLVEVDRSGLVAGYIGQTAIKTAKVLESALGSVLFIDEAYSLTSRSENDFGSEAVDTILKSMEDNRDDLVVIVAGYTDLMERFINSNPGLRSRFNRYIYFADYSAQEMVDIFKMNCNKSCYSIDDETEEEIADFLETVEYNIDFGNARGVRNIFEKILTEQANRIAEMETVSREDLMKITLEDVKKALYGENVLEIEEAIKSNNNNEDAEKSDDEKDDDHEERNQ